MQTAFNTAHGVPQMVTFIFSSGDYSIKAEAFEDSPEYDDWIESGGRDEDYSKYYNKWHRRVNKNS